MGPKIGRDERAGDRPERDSKIGESDMGWPTTGRRAAQDRAADLGRGTKSRLFEKFLCNLEAEHIHGVSDIACWAFAVNDLASCKAKGPARIPSCEGRNR